jgi:RecB family exonuclease
MMQIVYFSRKDQFLIEMEHIPGPKIYITPSPAKADGLRLLLNDTSSADVITIAKFTSDLINNLWTEDEQKPKMKRKSELLLIFGILKNKYLPELGFEQFLQAYNLFSDLRSFTMNQDTLASVLEEQPEEIRQAVSLFWRLLDVTGFVDEHGAYSLIAETLRSIEEKPELKKTYVFWGFQHLNGQQVDLVKALAIRYEVIIPFPHSLKDKLKRSDWLSWLNDSKTEEKILELIPQRPKAMWLKVNSREIARHLKNLIQPGDQILLGVSKLTSLHLDIVPSRAVSFKVSHQLVKTELQELHYNLSYQSEKWTDSKEMIKVLQEMRLQLVKAISESGTFKQLKAIDLYLDALELMSELSDEEHKVDRFFLKLLFEVVSLNQPRTSFVPMSSEDFTIDLKDMSSLEEIKRNQRVLVCVDDRFDEVQSLGQNYTESIQKSLAALGPLKRNELELLFKQWEFFDLFTESEVIVLMAESTLKHSLIWKRLFSAVILDVNEERVELTERRLIDSFSPLVSKQFQGSFSASKFQNYLDCPRKFYFNYVDKIFPSITLNSDLDALASGTISHRIIEIFYESSRSLEELNLLTREVMQKYMLDHQIALAPETLLRHELVFNHRARNGIEFLQNLESLLQKPIQWQMEKSFALTGTYDLKGKIDCIGKMHNHIFLLDFKSTKFAASSNKEIEGLENLQLWTYAKAAAEEIPEFKNGHITIGFISLDNPAESNLLSTDSDLVELIKSAKLCRPQSFKTSFPDLFEGAQNRMQALVETIKQDKIFPARPRKADACKFCELTKVCIKGEIS